MSKKMIDFLREPETVVVFDVDGVLASYEFGDLHHGVNDETWEKSFEDFKHNPYCKAVPLPVLQEFIFSKGINNVYVCSKASQAEEVPKTIFIESNYGIPSDHIFFVPHESEKKHILKRIRCIKNVNECQVAIVEDTVKTLDDILSFGGFTTVHITSFFDYM